MTPRPGDIASSTDSVRNEIRERVLAAVRARARAIYLHGSRVDGTARPKSDWDVAVVLAEPVVDWPAESLRLAALFYSCPFAVDLQVFGEDEFCLDAAVPGTLPYAIARRGERLYDHAA
jgi:predicted nucleotidyltransferase